MSNLLISRKQIIFIKSFRVLNSISMFFKSVGYYQGFHYIAIFLANLDFSEEVRIFLTKGMFYDYETYVRNSLWSRIFRKS